METPNKVVFIVKRYAVRNAKIRPFAVRRPKWKQYLRGTQGVKGR